MLLENGFLTNLGSISVCEIIWTEETWAAYLQTGHCKADTPIPEPLCNADNIGARFDCKDPKLRMEHRRFGVVDGNHRVAIIMKLAATNKEFVSRERNKRETEKERKRDRERERERKREREREILCSEETENEAV